jgi:hypothetical protein
LAILAGGVLIWIKTRDDVCPVPLVWSSTVAHCHVATCQQTKMQQWRQTRARTLPRKE